MHVIIDAYTPQLICKKNSDIFSEFIISMTSLSRAHFFFNGHGNWISRFTQGHPQKGYQSETLMLSLSF